MKLHGNTSGLKTSQIRKLEKLYRRRIQPQSLISAELSRELAQLSADIHRQLGVLIDRRGRILHVLVGDPQKIVIPPLSEHRAGPGRLAGLRCVHTHLDSQSLTKDDLTDLVLLRLDMMAVLTITADGFPRNLHIAHVLPGVFQGEAYRILDPVDPYHPEIHCLERITALEAELTRSNRSLHAAGGSENALLVSVTAASRKTALDALKELEELAKSCGIHVLDTVLQHRDKADARYLMGRGKLNELHILALQRGVTLLVFDQELNPSQIRSITDQVALKVIDRTQLILDIFAQRAQSREGKLQVELAQMKYLLPRLVTKNTAMSRLTGGIGGRGPGETKLEINRRRVRERITALEKAIQNVRSHRAQQRARRQRRGLPVVSIIGYTNAGKSTLLNTLTKSHVLAEDKLFATLDPSSRRLRFPRDLEVIVTDTVGFIRHLPKELMAAFRATLEELEDADLLLHVIDIANPRFEDQIASVEKLLCELGLDRIPVLRVLNKCDLLDAERAAGLMRSLDGIQVCARQAQSLAPLFQAIEARLSGFAGQNTGPPHFP